MTNHHLAPSHSSDQALASSSTNPTMVATLDRFIAVSSALDGVQIDQLEPLTELSVRTWNSVYEILVVEPTRSRICVRGGQFFPVPTNAILGGSTLGGSCLKRHWIGEGFRMEVHSDDDLVIVTSPVRGIQLDGVYSRGRQGTWTYLRDVIQ